MVIRIPDFDPISEREQWLAKYWGGDWRSHLDGMHFEWTGRRPWLEDNATPLD